MQFSSVVAAQPRNLPGFVSLRAVDLDTAGDLASPVLVLDDFRVRALPFSPHPHAGFSAVTYVLEDSRAGVRSRSSLGNDIVVGPGGIVWTQAGSGLIHEEVPADEGRELHGLQIFVNLSAENKLAPPQVFQLGPAEIPLWRSDAGDRVRVVVGSFEDVSSPLVPVEPFTLLDVELRREVSLALAEGHNAVVYVLKGNVVVRTAGREQKVSGDHALAVGGSGGRVTFEASGPAHLVLLSGAATREPVIFHGPFILSNQSQIDETVARYQAGEMGTLERVFARSRESN